MINNNRNAIPAEVFLSFTATQADDFLHPYNTGNRLATCTTGDPDFPIVWQTVPLTQHGHTFLMRFTLDLVDNENGCTRGLFHIIGAGQIRLSQRLSPIPTVGGQRSYASWQSGSPPLADVHFDMPWWGTDLNTIGLTVSARRWGT